MKLFVLSLITLMCATEVFAQRGPRYNPPGRGDRNDHRPGPGPGRYDNDRYDRHDHDRGRNDYRPGPVIVRPGPGPVVINPGRGRVVIRQTYRPGRVYRDYRRPPIIWSVPFGYSCGIYGDLRLNGRTVHTFRYSMDCQAAITDIRLYGDFCDDDVMYDQSGYMEAQFYSNYECRESLGYYY